MVASDQFAHVAIAEQFGSKEDADEEDEDDEDDEYVDEEGGWFFASSAAVSRFNQAIEAWLHHAHSVCPIVLAYRREDFESGGTQLSDWHAWSVRQLPQILEHTKAIIESGRDDHRTHMMIGAIEMAHEAKLKLDPEILDWARPERALTRALKKGDAQALEQVLARHGARARAALDDLLEPTHARTLIGAADALLPIAELDDKVAVALVCAALAEPSATHADAVLEQARARLRAEPSWGDYLAYEGHGRTMAKDWPVAIGLFEMVLDVPKLGLSGYNNALYAIMQDNNGLPIDEARHRRFLAAALPHGSENPSIFYNAACVYMELGEVDRVFEHIALAIRHGYPDVEKLRDEALFDPLRTDPRFAAAFESAPKGKKKASKKKTSKKKTSKKS